MQLPPARTGSGNAFHLKPSAVNNLKNKKSEDGINMELKNDEKKTEIPVGDAAQEDAVGENSTNAAEERDASSPDPAAASDSSASAGTSPAVSSSVCGSGASSAVSGVPPLPSPAVLHPSR